MIIPNNYYKLVEKEKYLANPDAWFVYNVEFDERDRVWIDMIDDDGDGWTESGRIAIFSHEIDLFERVEVEI